MSSSADRLVAVVGGKTAKVLSSALALETVGDLLRHYPRRYVERGNLTDLGEVQVGEHVTVMAEVTSATVRRMRDRNQKMLEVVIGNGRDRLRLIFFRQTWREKDLFVGRRALFSGKVTLYQDSRQLAHPEYLLLEGTSAGDADVAAFTEALIPIYPASGQLPSWRVSQAVRLVLDTLDEVPDPLPTSLRSRHDLPSLTQALRWIHQPTSWGDVTRARQRLRWDEAFLLQTALAARRQAVGVQRAVPRPTRTGGIRSAFEARLPFTLTDGQLAVEAEIAADLARDSPMQRLLQGEVGSGKTVVALLAMLNVIDAGGQCALLAPTEVLAGQHYRSIRALLGGLGSAGELDEAEHATQVVLLTGSSGAAARRHALAAAASGEAGIVIGTHALLEESVVLPELGLVVVDEQHRFGVDQRSVLSARAGERPHELFMSATPIPRSVAMTVFGDLEVSTLRELPKGRAPISTVVVPADRPIWVERMWRRIREEASAGRQTFVVCPRIGEDGGGGRGRRAPAGSAPEEDRDGWDELDVDLPQEPERDQERASAEPAARARPAAGAAPLAVLEVAPRLSAGPLSELRLGVLHGRLPTEEKDSVMRSFGQGELDVLVATTVIEVGVDVPNATVMVVMDAHRFGMSQLHQLRGRIGRGSAPGTCLLYTEMPEGPGRARLEAVAATTDGFALSELDLEARGEGTVTGALQHGRSTLTFLSLARDVELIVEARAASREVIAEDPRLTDHPVLAEALAELLGSDEAAYLGKA